MDFSLGSLVLSSLIGGVGFVLFMYGRKQGRLPQMATGLVLLVYPYFIPNLWVMGGLAVALLAGLWLALRLGH